MQKGDKADAWMVVDKEKKRALVWCVRGLNIPNDKGFFLRLKGLETECVYRMNEKQYSSDVLMNCGIRICPANKDFVSNLFYLEKLTQ